MKVQKKISIILTSVMLMGCLTACGNNAGGINSEIGDLTDDNVLVEDESVSTALDTNNDGKRLSIVTTIFPEYDWVREIMGEEFDDADVTMLLDNGVDLHSFQPTAQDILTIGTCDLFVYVGGESDKWVDDALKEATNKDMVVIDLLDVLGDSVKEEEVVEGMEADEDEGDEEEIEYDEHVWLSLKNARILCDSIADALMTIDLENAEVYEKNLNVYNEKLASLDAEYLNIINDSPTKTILFGDRFPFRYMADDYGLNYYAAFVGCSAETEASFETVTFLSGKVDELGLSAIMTIEGTDNKIAETIRDNTSEKNQAILCMDSLQSTTSKEVAEGKKYLDTMSSNLDVLKQALK